MPPQTPSQAWRSFKRELDGRIIKCTLINETHTNTRGLRPYEKNNPIKMQSVSRRAEQTGSEVSKYLNRKGTQNVDPLKWKWSTVSKSRWFRKKIFINQSKKIFSTAGIIVRLLRSRLSSFVIDQIVLWNKNCTESADYCEGDNVAWLSEYICSWYSMHVHSLHEYNFYSLY